MQPDPTVDFVLVIYCFQIATNIKPDDIMKLIFDKNVEGDSPLQKDAVNYLVIRMM